MLAYCCFDHRVMHVLCVDRLVNCVQALAKEIVMSRKVVNRLHENKAQLNSISMHLGESVGIASRTYKLLF